MKTLCRRESAAKNRFICHLQMTFSCVFLLLIVPSMESRYRKSDTHVELIYGNTYTGVERLHSDLNGYVWWYNHQRLHSTLDYMSPVEFARQGKTL